MEKVRAIPRFPEQKLRLCRNNSHMSQEHSPEPEHPPRISPWASDLSIMLIIVASLAVPGPRPPFAAHVDAAVLPLAAVVAAMLMPLRRRWPLMVFSVSLAIYVFTVLIGTPALGPGIAASVAAFAVANRTFRMTAFIVGGFGAGVLAVLSFSTSGQMTLDPQVFQIAAGVAIATAFGDSARSRREYTRAVTERAERAEQTREAEARRRVAEERLRIAQDLHDTVAHRISVISLSAGVASSALSSEPDKAREALGTIRGAAREVLSEIGVLLRYLRAEEGEPAAYIPQPGINDLNALVQDMEESGLAVDLEIAGDLSMFDEMTGRVVYRVVQEGLTNAHKHGAGHTASVRITSGGEEGPVTVIVVNPVSVTDRNQPEAPRGQLGLTGLRERVSAIGGSVRAVESSDAFRLTVELPRRRKDLR